MADRSGIEIDYCTACRGVWLDRGELDKIIERSMLAAPSPAAQPAYRDERSREPYREPRYEDRRDDRRRYDDDDDDYKYGKKKKRGGFLSEIFDFD